MKRAAILILMISIYLCVSISSYASVTPDWEELGDFGNSFLSGCNLKRSSLLRPKSKNSVIKMVFIGDYLDCGIKLKVALRCDRESIKDKLLMNNLGEINFPFYTHNSNSYSDLTKFLSIFVEDGVMEDRMKQRISEIIQTEDKSCVVCHL